MGTNYYHKTNICPQCGRFDEAHIGKSSAGWQFSFRGYPEIRSYKDWIKELKRNGVIYDEYGRGVTLREFKSMVASKKSFKNHYDYCKIDHPESVRDQWKDENGFSFQSNEFF